MLFFENLSDESLSFADFTTLVPPAQDPASPSASSDSRASSSSSSGPHTAPYSTSPICPANNNKGPSPPRAGATSPWSFLRRGGGHALASPPLSSLSGTGYGHSSPPPPASSRPAPGTRSSTWAASSAEPSKSISSPSNESRARSSSSASTPASSMPAAAKAPPSAVVVVPASPSSSSSSSSQPPGNRFSLFRRSSLSPRGEKPPHATLGGGFLGRGISLGGSGGGGGAANIADRGDVANAPPKRRISIRGKSKQEKQEAKLKRLSMATPQTDDYWGVAKRVPMPRSESEELRPPPPMGAASTRRPSSPLAHGFYSPSPAAPVGEEEEVYFSRITIPPSTAWSSLDSQSPHPPAHRPSTPTSSTDEIPSRRSAVPAALGSPSKRRSTSSSPLRSPITEVGEAKQSRAWWKPPSASSSPTSQMSGALFVSSCPPPPPSVMTCPTPQHGFAASATPAASSSPGSSRLSTSAAPSHPASQTNSLLTASRPAVRSWAPPARSAPTPPPATAVTTQRLKLAAAGTPSSSVASCEDDDDDSDDGMTEETEGTSTSTRESWGRDTLWPSSLCRQESAVEEGGEVVSTKT